MKVKVIKRADAEMLGERTQPAPKTPKRKRITGVIEKWVADVREQAETESRISFDDLFHPKRDPST